MRWFIKQIALLKQSQNGSITGRILKPLFGKYLLLTNTVTSGLLMGIGDYGSQKIENRFKTENVQIDWTRLSNMAIVGTICGPLHHFAYKWMDLFLPGNSIKIVFQKIAIDQFIMGPVCIFQFFYFANLLEGKPVSVFYEEVLGKFLTVYAADWLVWPPTQFINFYFFSPKYRVIYVNLITTAYNVFLSYIKHEDMEEFKKHKI